MSDDLVHREFAGILRWRQRIGETSYLLIQIDEIRVWLIGLSCRRGPGCFSFDSRVLSVFQKFNPSEHKNLSFVGSWRTLWRPE